MASVPLDNLEKNYYNLYSVRLLTRQKSAKYLALIKILALKRRWFLNCFSWIGDCYPRPRYIRTCLIVLTDYHFTVSSNRMLRIENKLFLLLEVSDPSLFLSLFLKKVSLGFHSLSWGLIFSCKPLQ